MKIFKSKKFFIVVGVVLGLGAFFVFSPYPAVWVLKAAYMNNHYTMPDNYGMYKDNVTFVRDIDYGSHYPDGTLDIIYPKELTGQERVIFFVHGGSFIGGDKTDVEHFFVLLANEGFITVNINYSVAPKSHYPVPIKQIEEAFLFIKNNADKYKLNVDKVFFGGDSAGGQLVAQFINIQTNPAYVKQINDSLQDLSINVVIDRQSILGVLLFCALYDFESLISPKENTMILPFKKVGWAYFGSSDETNPHIALASLIGKVTKDFPDTFITDGNSHSFDDQARDFEADLIANGVYVKGIYYDQEMAKLKHDYQFYMDDEYSMKTFNEVLEFLNNR